MKISSGTRLLVLAVSLSLALLSGCGSSTSKNTVSSTENVFFAYALLPGSDGGILYGSGFNGYGQLGDSTLGNTYWFAPVIKSPLVGGGPLNNIRGYATGANQAIAFDNHSTIWVWGSNFQGRLGVDTYGGVNLPTSGGSAYSAYALPIYEKGSIGGVATGWKHCLALIGSQVLAWGDNSMGQVGVGSVETAFAFPVAVPFPENTVIKKVAAGGSHSLALTDSGIVYAWGYNAYGQAGKDSLLYTYIYYPDPVTITSGLTVNNIWAAGSYNLALMSDNKTIYGWGYGAYGQLGNPYSATLYGNPPRPVVDQDATTAHDFTGLQQIATGQMHVLALVNGVLYSWGDNEKGQLGLGTVGSINSGSTLTTKDFVQPYVGEAKVINDFATAKGATITDIYASGNTSYAKIGGHWYGWGDNNWGQLAQQPPTTTVSYILTPIPIGGGNPNL